MKKVKIVDSEMVYEVIYKNRVVKVFPGSKLFDAYSFSLNFKSLDDVKIRQATYITFEGGINDVVSCSAE